MTVKELMKILAGTPGDMEVMLSIDEASCPLHLVDRVETSEDGELLWLFGPSTFEEAP